MTLLMILNFIFSATFSHAQHVVGIRDTPAPNTNDFIYFRASGKALFGRPLGKDEMGNVVVKIGDTRYHVGPADIATRVERSFIADRNDHQVAVTLPKNAVSKKPIQYYLSIWEQERNFVWGTDYDWGTYLVVAVFPDQTVIYRGFFGDDLDTQLGMASYGDYAVDSTYTAASGETYTTGDNLFFDDKLVGEILKFDVLNQRAAIKLKNSVFSLKVKFFDLTNPRVNLEKKGASKKCSKVFLKIG